MSIEVATFVTDFQPVNPPSGDPRGQGDDHIRLMKQVLQNSFPTASKAWYNPNTISKSADFTVLAAQMNMTFLVDTTGGLVNMTLPILAAGDAGWECFLIKSNTGTNPVLVKPGSGTLNSGEYAALAAARRSIPGRRVSCLWTGTVWFISRNNTLPVSSLIPAQGAGLPVGYEYPNGQTLASVATNYPELNAVLGSGVLIDVRGRAEYALDNLGGSAATRITTNTFSSVTAIGGVSTATDQQTLLATNIPSITSTNAAQAISVSGPSGHTMYGDGAMESDVGSGGGDQKPHNGAFLTGVIFSANNSISVTSTGTNSTPFARIAAAIIVNKFMIVE